MMKTPFYLVFFAVVFSFGKINAQEQLVPLTFNPVQAADAIRIAAQRSAAASPTDTVALYTTGLRDNFSYDSHRPDTSLWETNGSIINNTVAPGVFINRTWARSPINIGVCTFDGLQWNGEPYNHLAPASSTGRCDELMSRPIDLAREMITSSMSSPLSVADSVYLSFWYQPGGFGYMPNAQDSFLLDINIPAWNPDPFTLVWKNIWFKEGYNAGQDSSFHIVMIKLDSASYFTSGFRFRFRNYASQCGSNDHWHLDNVYLKSHRTINDVVVPEASFVYQMPSLLKDYQAMPARHYLPSVNMADRIGVTMRNNDTLSTGRHVQYSYDVINSLGVVTYTYAGGDSTLLTYDSIGYSNIQTHAHPLIYPSNFSGFPQGDTTFYTIRHKFQDANGRIDSADFRQKFYNFYAYDDGTAEVGYGLYGQYSQLAYKFTMPPGIPDTLVGIQMYFLPVFDIDNLMQREFTLKVWSDGGNQPGTVLYSHLHQTPEYNFETPDRFVTYPIDSVVLQLSPSQTYYIGWEQQAIDRLYIGFDYNTDHSDKIYYNTSGNWNQSIFDGSLMMRPVFGSLYPIGQDETGIVEQTNSAFSIYPNPANDEFVISGTKEEITKVNIVDVTGRVVLTEIPSGNRVDVSSLSNGLYFVQLENKSGVIPGTKRLVISK
jgi:hypothetical protein